MTEKLFLFDAILNMSTSERTLAKGDYKYRNPNICWFERHLQVVILCINADFLYIATAAYFSEAFLTSCLSW